MTIIVFLIDTSASMNARCYLGGRPTLLDVAKGAVETFVKVRQRSPESRGDRYMLLSFEDPPQNIKAGWKENLATFMNELKNLRSDGLTTMGPALKNAFDLLNINRMQSGIDTYGQGRCPFFLEPSVIVVITDGGKLTSLSGIQEDFNLPMHSPIPGSELTREPFRWDQRLFSLVLRLPGTPALEQNIGLVPSDTSPIDAMCEVTGGRSYCITSHRIMIQCIDSLVQKVQSGVVINFEKIGPEPLPPEVKSESDSQTEEYNEWMPLTSPNCSQESNGTRSPHHLHNNSQNSQISLSLALSPSAWHNCRRLIYVARSAQKGFAVGYWPIPENFWPDLNSASLPPRSAHPNVKFTCTSQEPMVIENLPFDKYELEPSPLTQYILARKQPTVCWQVFVANSYKNSEVGHPFGYLKASTNLTCVNLFVMPYNYPVLLPLLDELFKVHRLKPTNEWRTQFQNYLRTMPPYYAGPLKRALIRMSTPGSLAQTLIPDAMESSLSYSVLNYLKRLKNQAKSEFDRMCNEVGNKTAAKAANTQEGARVLPRSPLRKELVSHPLLQDKFISLREQLNEFGGFVVGIPQASRAQQVYLNPGDIPRVQLVEQYNLLRERFFNPYVRRHADNENDHNLPVNQMGNYQEYLKRMPMPLREIESTPVRQHMFGNPFKIDKRMMVDEADIDLVAGGSSPARGTKRSSPTEPSPRLNNKRKPGPLPKDFVARRPVGSGKFSVVNSVLSKYAKHSKKSPAKNIVKSATVPKHVATEVLHPEYVAPKLFDAMPPKLTSIIDQDDEISSDDCVNLKMPIIDEEVGFNYDAYQSQVQHDTPEESRPNKGDKIIKEEPADDRSFKPNAPVVNGPIVNAPLQNGYPVAPVAVKMEIKMDIFDPQLEAFYPNVDVTQTAGGNAKVKLEVPKMEVPKKEVPKKDVPKKEVPKKEVPKKESTKKEVPKKEVPKKEVPKKDVPKKDVSKKESPKKEVPKKEIIEQPLDVDWKNEPTSVKADAVSSILPKDEEREPAEVNGNGIAAEPVVAENAVDVESYNMKIRSMASMEVRKPGRRHGPLIEQLKTLKGNLDIRLLVVEDIISEALRFKRFFLAGLLQDFASTNEFLAVTTYGMDIAPN